MDAGTFCPKASPQIKLLKWSLSEAFVLSTSAGVKYILRQPNCSGKIIIGGTFWTFTIWCCKSDKNVRILCKRKQNYSLRDAKRDVNPQKTVNVYVDVGIYFFQTHQHTAKILHSTSFSARAIKLNTVCPVPVKLERKNGPLPAILSDESCDGPCVTPGSPTYKVALVFVLLECFA